MVEQQDPRSLQAPQGMASGIYFDADSYGRDAFVEADAAWKPYVDAAIDEDRRAVGELVEAGLI